MAAYQSVFSVMAFFLLRFGVQRFKGSGFRGSKVQGSALLPCAEAAYLNKEETPNSIIPCRRHKTSVDKSYMISIYYRNFEMFRVNLLKRREMRCENH
jgi:hypothetical protein